MKITVELQRVYGKVLYYPKCELSRFLARLGKRKQKVYCLTQKSVKELRRLGFRVVEVEYHCSVEG